MVTEISTWQLNSLALADVTKGVRIEDEGGAGFVDQGTQLPGRDGVHTDDDAPYGPLNLTLRTILRYTDSAGAVTDPDGEGGHVFDNLSKIKREFAGGSLATLKRTLPHISTVRVLCRLAGDPYRGELRHIYYWPLVVPSGSWQSDTEQNSGAASTTPSVTTDGDKRVHDPRINFAAAGTLTHTEADGDSATVEVKTGPTFPVDVYIAGTNGSGYLYAEDNGGNDVTGDVELSKPYGLRFPPNSSPSLSADVNVIVYWRNRWA